MWHWGYWWGPGDTDETDDWTSVALGTLVGTRGTDGVDDCTSVALGTLVGTRGH